MKRILTLLAILILGTSCLKLDGLLYNPNADISAYLLDEFEGETEIQVDDSYGIDPSLIQLFTLKSDPQGENVTIHAVYVGDINSISTDTVLLYLHGNAGHLDFYWSRIKLLANTGGKNRFGVLAIDYRGYGLSEGTPSEEGLYQDADAAMLWLKDNGLTSNRLVIYGYSMGTAPATELTSKARTLQPSKLMLEAPFASDEVMVQDGSGLSLPGNFFSGLEINNAEEITEIDEPFFWIHGTNDSFLSIETHGEVVFKNYDGSYSEAHRVEGAEHNDVPAVMGYGAYLEVVSDFITR